MNWLLHYFVLSLLPTIVLLHLFVAPYTKVEESFNIQAIHDIATYGIPFSNPAARLAALFDHVSFPGAVPRTFVGAIAVAGLSWPFLDWVHDPLYAQICVRAVVGLANAAAMLSFHDAVAQAFGRTAGYWYILLQSSQFHVMYYASRTLPNMYAFGLCTLAFRHLLLSHFGPRVRRANRTKLALYLITIAGVVFRAELAVLLATHVYFLVYVRGVSLRAVVIPAGAAALVVGLLTTVGIDSFLWQQFPLWPEWTAFRFNAVDGKSAEWGTSPRYHYLFSSIPKLMHNPFALLVCIPMAFADPKTRTLATDILAPLGAFVALYSLLLHKEWRFIIYIVPGLTAVAAAGAAHISSRRAKHWAWAGLSLVLAASIAASFAASALLLHVSSLNYPGAVALSRLHALEANTGRGVVRVHLDNLACQTGVTRFLCAGSRVPQEQGQTAWYYDKTEDEAELLDPRFWQRFDYVLAEGPERVIGKWEVVEEVLGFSGVGLVKEGAEEEARQTGQPGVLPTRRPRGRKMAHVVEARKSAWAAQMESVLGRAKKLLRTRVTGGWWLEIRMTPRIRILKKQER